MKRLWGWLNARPFVACALMLTFVVGGAYVVQEIRVGCIEDWARQTTERSERLYNNSSLWRYGLEQTLRTARSGDREAATDAFDAWVRLTDQLDEEGRKNPVPDAPSLRC